MDYTSEQIMANLESALDGTLNLVLDSGDTAWNPASTKVSYIYGPCLVTYHQYPDGGIEATVK